MDTRGHRTVGSQAPISNKCPLEGEEMIWKHATGCSNKNACTFKDKLTSMYLKRPNTDRS